MKIEHKTTARDSAGHILGSAMMIVPRVHATFDWTDLTYEPGDLAFGYYDRQPWDPAGHLHLALRMPQQERLPEPGERATVGVIQADTRRFETLAETEAWCHQQGSMTHWLPRRPDCVIYNDFQADGGRWLPVTRVHDLRRGRVDTWPFQTYSLSPDGRWAATLDFSRNPRRGYAYARGPLPADRPLPDIENDGLFIVDLESGRKRLVASYAAMLAQFPAPFDLDGSFLGLEHAIFNCDSSRVMVLLRNSPSVYSPTFRMWRTYLYSVNVDGSDLRCTLPEIYWRLAGVSHQIWGRTPREIMVDGNWFDRGHEYLIFDESSQPVRAQRLSPGLGPMGHLLFSPDGRWIVADTYTQPDGCQLLALVEVATGAVTVIGRFRHPFPVPDAAVRCDLHPRWSRDGRMLTVDTVHTGQRRIFAFETEQVLRSESRNVSLSPSADADTTAPANTR